MTQHTPLPGPIAVDPSSELLDLASPGSSGSVPDTSVPDTSAAARAMLAAALDGIQLGAYDEQVIAWLQVRDASTVAVVASLLRRAWTAGLAAGRMEIREERTR